MNRIREQTSEHSQQRIAKCKQRFVFSCAGFNYRSRQCKQVTDKAALNHICAIPSPPRLESAALSRNIAVCKRLP
ncbi:hypothetical protein GCL00_02710 [Klebsiella pneumoniae]|nr:hypothetical protein GCK88_17555 [Klebsiella pneumoniae]KAB7967772.1 hypothetical protein GCK99_07490 [Klebsiella pneumoniae]KAB8037312.1 hypothetical protein GCL00_02710 [Klebsiella pneumoniae]HBY9486892.1 hypothetical protein [Klebsiella pneumoniae]